MARNAALPQLIKVSEEFLNTDTFHYDGGFKTIFDISGVIRDVDMCLSETVIDHINRVCGVSEECANLLWSHADLLVVGACWAFGLVGREHVLGSIDILAEMEVVDLLSVAAVAVTARDQVEQLGARRHDIQVFHDAQELLRRDVLRLGSVEVLETWLQQDSVADDVPVQRRHHLDHLLFLLVAEVLFELGKVTMENL